LKWRGLLKTLGLGVCLTSLLYPSSSYALTGDVVVQGDVEATIISVSIPAVVNFSYDPNTSSFTSNDITVTSSTNAKLNVTLNKVEADNMSEWKPMLKPYREWKTKTESESFIGFYIKEKDNVNKLINPQDVYFESIGKVSGGQKMDLIGVLPRNETTTLEPHILLGKSFSGQKNLKLNIELGFELN